METGFIPQLAVVAVSAAAAAAIAIFQHYSRNNFVYLLVGMVVFLGVLGWTDPDPNLHPYKVLLAGLGAGMWVSAVRDESRRRRSARDSDRTIPG